MGGGGFRGGFRGGFGRFGRVFPSQVGRFPRNTFRFGRFNQFGNGNMGGGFFGGGFGDSGFGYPVDFGALPYDQSQAGPSVVVMPPPPPPEPPPPPANPVIREYNWPNTDTGSPVFLIVTNDRTVHEATMVWSDGGSLLFTTPAGTTGRVPRSSISRELTRQANPGKNLIAWLP
jgi:hypothetical protein